LHFYAAALTHSAGGVKDFSRVCIQSGVAENPFLPGGLAESAQDIFKRNRCLSRVPGPLDGRLWGEAMAGLCVPQQGQIIDIEDEVSCSLRGLGDTVLRVFQAEELFYVAKPDLKRPASSKVFQYLCRFHGQVSMLSRERMTLYGGHFPWAGMGYVAKEKDGFRYFPEATRWIPK
jgi:hypothetical protein